MIKTTLDELQCTGKSPSSIGKEDAAEYEKIEQSLPISTAAGFTVFNQNLTNPRFRTYFVSVYRRLRWSSELCKWYIQSAVCNFVPEDIRCIAVCFCDHVKLAFWICLTIISKFVYFVLFFISGCFQCRRPPPPLRVGPHIFRKSAYSSLIYQWNFQQPME